MGPRGDRVQDRTDRLDCVALLIDDSPPWLGHQISPTNASAAA
jgi:hypothetical protein